MPKVTPHLTRFEESPRCQKMIAYMEKRGEKGATNHSIMYFTRCCSIPQTFFELTHEINGFIVELKFERTTKNGSLVYRRILKGRLPEKVWMAARARLGIKTRKT